MALKFRVSAESLGYRDPLRRIDEHTQASASRLWPRNSTSSLLFWYLHVRLNVFRAYICLSRSPSSHFKQLNTSKHRLIDRNLRETGRKYRGKPRLRTACWEIKSMTSPGIPSLPRVRTNQRARKGRETSNSQCLLDWVVFNVPWARCPWERHGTGWLPHVFYMGI